jgi:hypothetical protein
MKCLRSSRRHAGLVFWTVAALALAAPVLRAGLLPAAGWAARDQEGALLPATHDNDAGTGVLLQSDKTAVRCVIDLGAEHTVHRLFLTATNPEMGPHAREPLRTSARQTILRVYVSNRPRPKGPAVASRTFDAVTDRVVRVAANLRFQPTTGRYLVLELERSGLNSPWDLGEIEAYGWPGTQLSERKDAVTLPEEAAAPLRLAAEELSYYLGELAGRPVPIIRPSDSGRFPGTLFRIEDLGYLARTYQEMTNHAATGRFPATPINVEREGRSVIFRAWPYRHVLWSVWEFLDRQEVKWVYPDAHGDFVPTGRGIRLSVAPLRYTPSTDHIYANFGVEFLRDDPDAFLHFWRNRWTHTWGGHERDALGGAEIPGPPSPAARLPADYAEGFDGYPHNFRNVLPDRVLQRHPDWCGIVTSEVWAARIGAAQLNRRLSPDRNQSTFDLSSEGARQFIIDKAIACWDHQRRDYDSLYWLLPEDATLFSEDAASMRLRSPLTGDPVPFVMPYPYAVSGDYYDLVCHVADGLREALPGATVGAMAYANTHLPPERATPFPSNVMVEVCLYGSRNLPLASPANAEMQRRLVAWSKLSAQVRHYGYDLIHDETNALPMPVPLVGAMADRARFFQRHRMLAGGTQADLRTLPFNPWNYYAYPRFLWQVERGPDDVQQEFFTGFYREAAAPMLRYYDSIERHLLANDISLERRGYDYGPNTNAYPLAVLREMHQHLSKAERDARYWVTRQRVQKAREGFAWVLAWRGLRVEDLAPDRKPGATDY